MHVVFPARPWRPIEFSVPNTGEGLRVPVTAEDSLQTFGVNQGVTAAGATV